MQYEHQLNTAKQFPRQGTISAFVAKGLELLPSMHVYTLATPTVSDMLAVCFLLYLIFPPPLS